MQQAVDHQTKKESITKIHNLLKIRQEYLEDQYLHLAELTKRLCIFQQAVTTIQPPEIQRFSVSNGGSLTNGQGSVQKLSSISAASMGNNNFSAHKRGASFDSVMVGSQLNQNQKSASIGDSQSSLYSNTTSPKSPNNNFNLQESSLGTRSTTSSSLGSNQLIDKQFDDHVSFEINTYRASKKKRKDIEERQIENLMRIVKMDDLRPGREEVGVSTGRGWR